jgi:hypothetical protein
MKRSAMNYYKTFNGPQTCSDQKKNLRIWREGGAAAPDRGLTIAFHPSSACHRNAMMTQAWIERAPRDQPLIVG